MALNVYSPPETAVIHKTTVDIGNIRPMAQVVKLTQGDKSLPLIAVKLLNSGQPYEVPESATDAVFNFRKGDRKAVINSALGVSSDRQTVYVEATEQTCAAAGRGEAIVQIQVGEQVAGTGIFCIDVTPNPTTDASLSDTEIGVLQGLVDEANDAKADAQQSASEASQSATQAGNSANLAEQAKNEVQEIVNDFEGTLPLVEDAHGESVTVNNSSQDVIYGLKLYGKSVQDGTPSPENPVPIESVENVTVSITGKNLIDTYDDWNKVNDATYEIDGNNILLTCQKGYSGIMSSIPVNSLIGKYLIVKGNKNTDTSFIQIVTNDNTEKTHYTPYDKVCYIDENTIGIQIDLKGNNSSTSLDEPETVTFSNVGLYITNADGTTDTSYAPPTEWQELATQLNLYAVPVDSGGNYTDADGQQWIADVADFGTGKITRNVIAKTFNGTESLNLNPNYTFTIRDNDFMNITIQNQNTLIGIISNMFVANTWVKVDNTTKPAIALAWGKGVGVKIPGIDTIQDFKTFLSTNNLHVVGLRNTPTTEDIPAEVMQAYKALHTNATVTNVFTDSNPQAGIELRYRNDTKLADDVVEILDRRTGDMQTTIDSLSETVTEQESTITDLQGDVAETSALMYKPNLLINSDFRINQRNVQPESWVNASENHRVYGLDGWYCNIEDSGGGVSATSRQHPLDGNDGGVAVNLETNMGTFGQYFETYKTVDTITVVLGVYSGSNDIERIVSTFTGLANISNSGYLQKTIKLNNLNCYLRIYRVLTGTTNGYSLDLRLAGAGNLNINFAYIDAFEGGAPAPHYVEPVETALARCQRYFYRLGGGNDDTIGIGFLKNNNVVRTTIQFPVTMANKPPEISASPNKVFQVETETNAYNACVYRTSSQVTRDRATIDFTLSAPEQVSGPIGVTVYENTGAYIDFSCEFY